MAAQAEMSDSVDFKVLEVPDVFCFICRGVLIEPITLPCKHVFCKSCLESSLPETSYSCPLCRKRISNWLRSAKKENKLLNVKLWQQIQLQYKDAVTAKLSGADDGLDALIQDNAAPKKLSSGEIRQEFASDLEKFEQELRHKREAEERASMDFIKLLACQESENRKSEEEANLEMILRLKKEDEEELKKGIKKPLSAVHRKRKVSSSRKKPPVKVQVGPMDYHIQRNTHFQLPAKSSKVARSLADKLSDSTDSNDSIQCEMQYFKPIRTVPKTPPKRSYDGFFHDVVEVKKITPLKLFNESTLQENTLACGFTGNLGSAFSAFKDTHPFVELEPVAKKKRYSPSISEAGVLKEINLDENNDLSLILPVKIDSELCGVEDIGRKQNLDGAENSNLINKLLEEQRMLEQRIVQEKADRVFALKLSKQWKSYELRTTLRTTRQTKLTTGRRK